MKKLFPILLVLPLLSFANMRAARIVIEYPSFAIENASKNNDSTTKPNIEVLHETLKVDCDYVQCLVNAIYHITSNETEPLAFEFLLPAQAKINVEINASPIEAKLLPDTSERWQNFEQSSNRSNFRSQGIYKAMFTGSLQQGANTINVRYHQPLSSIEKSYGYFVRSRSVQEFTYILEPLKEWKKSDSFKINLEVSTLKKRPEAFALFKQRSINCFLPKGTVTKEKGKLVYRNKLGADFPDILTCQIGDKDLLKRR